MLSHLFSTVGCKTRLNRRHPEDQSRTCMSCVNSRPFAEATGPEAMRRRAAGGPPGRLARAAASSRAGHTEEASPGFLGHVVGAISNANVSGVGSFLPITVHFWHKLAKHLRRPVSRRAPGEARSDGGGRAVRLGHPLSSEGLWPSGHGLAGRLLDTGAYHAPRSIRLFFLFSSSNAHLLVLTRLSGSS